MDKVARPFDPADGFARCLPDRREPMLRELGQARMIVSLIWRKTQ
jgi:hypothetical protein